jgi:uncharacterized protein YbjT (DUF2867 family)
LFVRDPSRAPSIDGAEIAVGDFNDPTGISRALEPGDRLFMVSVHTDNAARVAIHQRFVDAVSAARARHIVYLSFIAAAENAINYHARSHAATEQMIRRSGVPWTFLRPSLYMEVLHRRFDGSRVMRAPAGRGRAAWVSQRDIAAVAASVLTSDGHLERSYEITGPQLLTMGETAAIVSDTLGRSFIYEDEPSEQGRVWRRREGQSDFEIEARIASWESVRAGEVAKATETVRVLTGAPPLALGDYVAQHAEEFP